MFRCTRPAIAALLLLASFAAAPAAIAPSARPGPGPRLQLLVIEVPGCFYCRLFRRDVLPRYEATRHARELPLQFLGLDDANANRLELKRPIETVPTVLVLRGGKEIARISGYPGPATFLRAIGYLLSQQH